MAIVEHPALINPDQGKTIWRYLDLEKFESLLKEKSLFFCRSDKFSDPFEGTIPKKEYEFRIRKEMHRAKLDNHEISYEQAAEKAEPISSLHRRFRRSFVVNCWHLNEDESDAMWRLYLKTNEGVAIQSTVGRLFESLKPVDESFYMSNIRYLDYENDIWFHKTDYPVRSYNLFTPIIHKRNAFQHESELRLFQQFDEAVDNEQYWNDKPNNIGKLVPCNLDTLIEKVILPPTSDNDVRNKVEEILRKYGLEREIGSSKLNEDPIY